MPDEKSITLSLTPERYRRLIELAYLGEWFINAHHDADFQDDGATEALQALLGAHAQAGVGRDEESGNFYIDSEWSDRLYDQYISDYDDHVFWEELTERLAGRDLAATRGVEPEQIDREEDLRALKPIEERYRKELEANGIDRLIFKEDF